MDEFIVTDAKIVTPRGIIDPGGLVINEGIISEILKKPTKGKPSRTIRAYGKYVLPGLINVHSDCIETELKLRRGFLFPVAPAMANLDRKLASWGITSEYHAISFSQAEEKGRSVALSTELVEAIVRFQQLGKPLVKHFVHVRCDPSTNAGTDLACEMVRQGKVDYASLQEHAPGVGQYSDLGLATAHWAKRWGLGETEFQHALERTRATRNFVMANEKRFAAVTSSYGVPLASHDDDTEEKVDYMYALGARLSEFPITLAVALKARSLGMSVCMGAPNAFRGKSQMENNISARDAVRAGVVDILCADYYPPSLLYATFTLSQEGCLPLIDAMNLVTLNPARFIGKGDFLGSLEEGKRGDIAVVRLQGNIPVVTSTLVEGKVVYDSAP